MLNSNIGCNKVFPTSFTTSVTGRNLGKWFFKGSLQPWTLIFKITSVLKADVIVTARESPSKATGALLLLLYVLCVSLPLSLCPAMNSKYEFMFVFNWSSQFTFQITGNRLRKMHLSNVENVDRAILDTSTYPWKSDQFGGEHSQRSNNWGQSSIWCSAVDCFQDVLGKLLQPPSDEAIKDSIKRLHNIGAFDLDEVLNDCGFFFNPPWSRSVHPHLFSTVNAHPCFPESVRIVRAYAS